MPILADQIHTSVSAMGYWKQLDNPLPEQPAGPVNELERWVLSQTLEVTRETLLQVHESSQVTRPGVLQDVSQRLHATVEERQPTDPRTAHEGSVPKLQWGLEEKRQADPETVPEVWQSTGADASRGLHRSKIGRVAVRGMSLTGTQKVKGRKNGCVRARTTDGKVLWERRG
jgi:hypothetical protein